jgi:hypothetical protein
MSGELNVTNPDKPKEILIVASSDTRAPRWHGW